MTSPTPARRHETGTDKLLVEVAGPVATVTFNNPDRRNALSAEMRDALPPLLDALNADGDVRVVVVTGAGDRAFASGADISEFGAQRTNPADRAAYDRGQAALAQAWASVDKPVIAMIRGFCLGGGLVTALQADIRIAADDSQFGIPAARLGLGYGFSGVTALMTLIGPARREAAQPAGQRDLARVEAMVESCFRSADYLEGQRAFTEKRPPAFTGR